MSNIFHFMKSYKKNPTLKPCPSLHLCSAALVSYQFLPKDFLVAFRPVLLSPACLPAFFQEAACVEAL